MKLKVAIGNGEHTLTVIKPNGDVVIKDQRAKVVAVGNTEEQALANLQAKKEGREEPHPLRQAEAPAPAPAPPVAPEPEPEPVKPRRRTR